MSEIKDGGPAFPHEYKYGDGTAQRDDGMTLRDYFAAKAMPHLIAFCQERDGGWSDDNVAQGAYLLADAMLRARGES